MPVFIAALLGGLVMATGSIVGRVLIALGVGFVVYTGVDVAVEQFRTQALSNIGALPAGMVGLAGTMKIGTGLNIIFSAIVARLALNGLTSGALKRMVWK